MKNLKRIIKENITPIIFFAGVLFIILTLVGQSTENKKNSSELINRINSLVSEFDRGIRLLSNTSITYSNTIDNYSSVKNELNTYSQKLEKIDRFQPQFQNENILIESYNVLVDEVLKNKNIFDERSSFIIENFEIIQKTSQIESLIEVLNLENFEIFIYEIADFINQIDKLTFSENQTFLKEIYLKNYILLDEIIKINQSSTENISKIDQIKKLDQKTKNYNPSFAYLDSSLILSKKYNDQITQIQQTQDIIKAEYSL
jgi:hypothetical protein